MTKITTSEIIENRYLGVAPEGFVLLHEKTIQDLENFEIWKEWKNDAISIQELNKTNFDNT